MAPIPATAITASDASSATQMELPLPGLVPVPAAGSATPVGLGLGLGAGEGDGAKATVTGSVAEWSFGLGSQPPHVLVKDAVLLTLGAAWAPTRTVMVKLVLPGEAILGVPEQVTT